MSFADYDWSLDFHQLTECDYGRKWPPGTDQITKELAGFQANGKRKGFLTRYEHGLNLIRLLWPDMVKMSVNWKHCKTGEDVVIWNHYFMSIFKSLCNGKRTALTGCSSSGKTFAVAVYAMLMFMCNPMRTTIMVSTTSGSDAERRVWGEIRDLHREAQKTYPVGTLIDYLKCITFDPGRELDGRKDVLMRDLRNGIMLIPIPQGKEGENAVGKVIGTKNGTVIWIIDELPNMIDDVLRPESNLESNEKFQLIGIGNAGRKSDPHGRMCEPEAGWPSITKDDEEWSGLFGTQVINCNGRHSPNFHEAVDQSAEDKAAYPFPFLATPPYIRKTALINGRGDSSLGENTLDFWRFAIGFWAGDDVSAQILSEDLVKLHNAHHQSLAWGAGEIITIAGLDCGFTADGDANEITFAKLGRGNDGRMSLLVERDSVRIIGEAGQERIEYRKSVARQVVEECKKRNMKPEWLGMDINADGGLMMQAIQKEWKSHDIIGLSSLEPADNDKYFHRVTQYWFQASLAVTTGSLRGFGLVSRYAKDLFARMYESVGKGKVKVEKKKDMKSRIGHSPDAGDSFCYMIEVAIRNGFDLTQPDEPSSQSTDDDGSIQDDLVEKYLHGDSEESSGFFESQFDAGEAEFEMAESSSSW